MKIENYNLKKVLGNYFRKRVNVEYLIDIFDKLILFLDTQYKLSDINDFDVSLVVDKEHHNKFYRFDYNVKNEETDCDTTVHICLVFSNKNPDNLGIMFDEITIADRDYPYGKTTIYLLDGTIETEYYDYNDVSDIKNNESYIKKLVKL